MFTSYIKYLKSLFFSVFAILFAGTAQETAAQQLVVPLHNELNYRFEKAFFADTNFHDNVKPFTISKAKFDSLNRLLAIPVKSKLLSKVLNNNILDINRNKLSLTINPVLSILPSFSTQTNSFLSDNQFGLSLNSFIGKKLSVNITGFYGIKSFSDSLTAQVTSSGIIPHYGETLNRLNDNTFDYLSLSGYISYQPLKYINFQLGKGKHFWGSGYRSLFLSDNANTYPYFKAVVDIWRFKYIWMVGALRDPNMETSPDVLKSKFQFSHYLSWNATKWLNFNFFESIVSNPVDSMGVRYFNINYLNPVIFFRPVEFAGGSADNALLGVGLNLKLFKKYRFYSQFLIDEFVFSEIKSGNGWWGNKFAVQAGMKVFNPFGLENIMFLGELNYIRPFTYSYSNSIQNYGNYKQALAHPAGANTQEAVALVHYHKGRFSSQIKMIYQISGIDTDSTSYGKDIYKAYTLRNGDYGHYTTQGLLTKYWHAELKTSWLVNPAYNMQLQFSVATRHISNNLNNEGFISFSFGLKTLVFNEDNDFF